MFKHTKLLIASLFIMLAGCESDEVSEEFRIAELKPINAEKQVETVWSRSLGSGVEAFYSNLSPVIVDDVLFAANRDGKVVAYDKNSGDTKWESDIRENPPTLWSRLTLQTVKPAKINGGLTAAYNNLYLGTEDGEVVAIEQASGKVLWRVDIKGEIISAPAAGEGWIVAATTSGKLTALHPDTGEIRWNHETDVPALSLRGTSSPTIANGGVLVGTATGKLTVIILDKGVAAWDTAISVAKGATELEQLVDADSKPLVIGATVYAIAYNGNLAAVDLSSGRIKWKREYSSYRNLAAEVNTVYVTDAKGNLIAIDSTNGIEQWSSSELYNRQLTQPVVFQDSVLVGDFEGFFHFFDKKTGKIIARYENDDFLEWLTFDEDGAYASPVVSDDKVYLQTRDGKIVALRLQ